MKTMKEKENELKTETNFYINVKITKSITTDDKVLCHLLLYYIYNKTFCNDMEIHIKRIKALIKIIKEIYKFYDIIKPIDYIKRKTLNFKLFDSIYETPSIENLYNIIEIMDDILMDDSNNLTLLDLVLICII